MHIILNLNWTPVLINNKAKRSDKSPQSDGTSKKSFTLSAHSAHIFAETLKNTHTFHILSVPTNGFLPRPDSSDISPDDQAKRPKSRKWQEAQHTEPHVDSFGESSLTACIVSALRSTYTCAHTDFHSNWLSSGMVVVSNVCFSLSLVSPPNRKNKLYPDNSRKVSFLHPVAWAARGVCVVGVVGNRGTDKVTDMWRTGSAFQHRE